MKERTNKGIEKALEVWRTSEDVRIKMEAQTDSTSFQFWTPRTARTKTDAQIAYGHRFGRTWYWWKDNLKTLPMELVLGPNSSRVDRKHLGKLTSSFCSALRRRLSVFGSCIMLDPVRGVSRGTCTTLGSLLAAATPLLGFGFCLSYSVKNSLPLDQFVRPQLVRLIIHL